MEGVKDVSDIKIKINEGEVVIDGNLVTSRHPGDLTAFIEASLQKLQQLSVNR
jgi:putative intracellular protease/amidase